MLNQNENQSIESAVMAVSVPVAPVVELREGDIMLISGGMTPEKFFQCMSLKSDRAITSCLKSG